MLRSIDTAPALVTTRSAGASLPTEQKHAERIARILEKEIVEMGWPVGQPLGNEDELVRRFNVSRWGVREAIAITERDGLTRRQRGRNGGLVVAAPAKDVVASAIRNYLLHVGVSGKHILEAIALLDHLAIRLAAARRTGEDVARMRHLLAQPLKPRTAEVLKQSLRENRQLLKMTHNPVLEVLGVALSQLFIAHGFYRSLPLFADKKGREPAVSEAARLRRRQIEHALAGDFMRAIELDLELARTWNRIIRAADDSSDGPPRALAQKTAERIVEQISALDDERRVVKRAETLALQIHYAIMVEGLKAGDRLASEAELTARYGVGRAVLREATRYLERHSFVSAEEGRNGGLRVGMARPDATIRSSLLYLKFIKPPMGDVLRVLRAVQDGCADIVTRRVVKHGQGCLATLSARLAAGLSAPHIDVRAIGIGVSIGLAAATANPIFELFMPILCGLYTIGGTGIDARLEGGDARAFVEELVSLEDSLRRGDARAARKTMIKVRERGLALDIREGDVELILAIGSS